MPPRSPGENRVAIGNSTCEVNVNEAELRAKAKEIRQRVLQMALKAGRDTYLPRLVDGDCGHLYYGGILQYIR